MAHDADNGTEASLRQLLEYRRERLKRELDAVEQLLGCLGGNISDTPCGSPEAVNSSADYASLKPQEAALRLLRDYPDKKFRPSAAARKLKKLGVRSASRTFSSLVSAALKRLAERGLAVREMDGSRPVYYLKKTDSATLPTLSEQ